MPIGPTSGFLDFTNATPRADVIVALSKIGIGTDAPLHALDLRGTANVANIIINNDLTLTGGLITNTLTINNVSMSTTTNFQQVTNGTGNVTTNTIEFNNPTTGLVVASNAEVGGELSVSGNVGVGTSEPTESLDIVGNLNLQQVSNVASIKLNSNVVTEYTRSKKLIKYPRVAMTANSSGGYTASASTTFGDYLPYLAFDNNITDTAGTTLWTSADGTYDSNDNYAYSSNKSLGGVSGEWLKLQLPMKIRPEYVRIYPRTYSPPIGNNQSPEDFVFLASNDDTNWVQLGSVTGWVTNATWGRWPIPSQTSYKYYAMVCTRTIGSTLVGLAEMELYGTPEYDPDAHGTDVVVRSVPNVPNTDWLEVYYDGQDYTSMPVTVTDKSGNGVTGTPNGGVGFDTEYKAFTFDRVDDYVTGSITASGNFVHSISMWFKPTVVDSSVQMLFFMASSGGTNLGRSIIFFDSSSGIAFDFRSKSIRYLVPPVANQWMHLVCTYDGNLDGSGSDDMKIYINGVKATNTVVSGASSTLNLINGTFWIGNTTGSTQHFGGSIANFRLFNRDLTGDEVWQLYAYQKEYFGHGNLGMTLKGGRLGIGTSEPRALLDVRGNFYSPGSVVQLQNRTFCLSYSSTSTTFTDTGAYVEITPKFNNSKLFLTFDGLAYLAANSACGLGIRAFRSIGGGTDQMVYGGSLFPGAASNPHDLCLYHDPGGYHHSRISISFSDIPNTSSSIRYKIYARAHVSGLTVQLGNSGHQPVAFSVFEIAQ